MLSTQALSVHLSVSRPRQETCSEGGQVGISLQASHLSQLSQNAQTQITEL